jgi:hypothetical protein
MSWIHVRHRVEDYPKWKEVFDSTAEYKRSHGWQGYRLFAIEGDNNHVLVMEEFETPEQAREFVGSDYLRDAMGRAGVSDQPDMQMIEVLEEGSERSGATRQAAQTVQEGAEVAGQTVQGGVRTTGQTVGGLLGATTGAVTDVTAGAVGAAAEGTERAMEAVAFPIEGYDEMNVDEISARLNDLSVEELQLVRDYEELHKRRESLLERMDRKIRSA